MNRNKKRNSEHGTGERDMHTRDLFEGVGARQANPPPQPGGGGYQNICTVLNFDANARQNARDPRLDELRDMGLQRIWLDVAEEIGVDALLKMWRILDNDHVSVGDNGRLVLPLCRYTTYLRYQRNRYIESLVDMGFTPAAIKARLDKQLSEQLSIRRISYISRSRRVAKKEGG